MGGIERLLVHVLVPCWMCAILQSASFFVELDD